MNDHFKNRVLQSTGGTDLKRLDRIQELWSGYGEIVRYGLKGSEYSSVVVKHVKLPQGGSHPRGWNTDIGHQRKVKSYEVETAWYSKWSDRCDDNCRVPKCFACEFHGDEVLIVLEDLNEAGFSGRRHSVGLSEIQMCLKWLANFHATYLGESPMGLWKVGTYWHLATRPDELKVLKDTALKNAAATIDQTLNTCQYKTFVHGDAKLANFCFGLDGKHVAAVDFQYVGGGCGMKDVAYFVGSCLHEADCEQMEFELLNYYFKALSKAVGRQEKNIDIQALEQEWRKMYPVAWTDFHRFMKGWSPGHWKINSYSERVARETLESL